MYFELGEGDDIGGAAANGVAILVVYFGCFAVAKWLLERLGKPLLAARVFNTGLHGVLGIVYSLFLVGLPLTLAGEVGVAIEASTFNSVTHTAMAVLWGWYARVGWCEEVSLPRT